MIIILELIFIVSFMVMFFSTIQDIALMLGRTITYPFIFNISIFKPWILYPSALYQIWFWSHKLGIF